MCNPIKYFVNVEIIKYIFTLAPFIINSYSLRCWEDGTEKSRAALPDQVTLRNLCGLHTSKEHAGMTVFSGQTYAAFIKCFHWEKG